MEILLVGISMQSQDSVVKNAQIVGLKIKSIKRLDKKEDVYCLCGLQNGTMIANGIITKNCDALRYVLATHKVATYQPYKETHNPDEYRQGRFNVTGRRFWCLNG